MFQYKRLFASCRIPGLTCDTIDTYKDSTHVLVICKAQMYEVVVIYADGTLISMPELVVQLKWIQTDAVTASEPPVAAFSTDNRTTWHHARNNLRKCDINRRSIDRVDR